MSIWEHARQKIFNVSQHPLRHDVSELGYVNDRIPGVTSLEDALNYLIAVLYPDHVGTYDNMAAALAANPTPSPNQYIIVNDDGDGHAAGYVYTVLDGVSAWVKRYDMDWSVDQILAATVNRTQYMYVQKYGMTDSDAAGIALTGINAGQHIYGGDVVNQHLTLHANSGDTLGAHTGFIQFDDNTRPTVDDLFDLGTSALRFKNGWFADTLVTLNLTANGDAGIAGDILVGGDAGITGALGVTGAITGSNLSGTNTGDVTLSAVGSSPGANGASLSGQVLTLQPADGTHPGVLTSGAQTIGGTKTFSGSMLVGVDLGVTGNITGANLSGTNTGDVTLGSFGASPNVKGASISGQVITLQPADATHPGLLSAAAQSIGGAKTFADNLRTNGTFTVDLTSLLSGDVTFGGNLINGAATFVTSELVKLRNVMFRDAGRTQAVQTGDSLFYDSSSGTWLASAPDTEIVHNTISGLTTGDAGHTQFALLAGRSGGQTLQGGTASGNSLVFESTSNASKGLIKFKDPLAANTAPSFSSTWSGTDVGDATLAFRHVYTKGEYFGLRFENRTSAPSNSAQNVGRVYFDTATGLINLDNGATWIQPVMTTSAQTIAGEKTFSDDSYFTGHLGIGISSAVAAKLDLNGDIAIRRTDVASASSIAALATTTSFIKLTGTTATTLLGLASGVNGKRVVVHNGSSGSLTVNHQDGGASAVNRVITPTGAALTIGANTSLEFGYDSAQSRWLVLSYPASGGGGSTAYVSFSVENITAGASITSNTTDGFQLRRVVGDSGPQTASTTPFGSGGGWTNGTVITLLGQDDANTLTLTALDSAKGALLRGDAVLGLNAILTLIYDATADRWLEMGRNF